MRAGLETTGVIANGSAFLSYFLLWAAIVWGILLRNGWALTRIRHSTVYAIHQVIALMGLVLGGVHAAALELARGDQIRWVDTVVPFADNLGIFGHSERYYYDLAATPVNRFAVSLGVLGLEIMIVAAASIVVQRRIGYSRWRGLHSLTYAAFSLVVAHVMMTGATVGPVWIWASVSASWVSTLVLWLLAPRLMALFDGPLGQALGFSGSPKPAMLVDVDTRVCGRAGFCTHAAPNVFRLRGNGKLVYRARITLDEVEAVSQAVQACPVRAITLGVGTPKGSGSHGPVIVSDDAGSTGMSSMSRSNGRRYVR